MTTIYQVVFPIMVMKTQTIQTPPKSIWEKMVHAKFRKVVAFDLLFMGLGIGVGVGVGAFLVS